jgi:hypothetical protein
VSLWKAASYAISTRLSFLTIRDIYCATRSDQMEKLYSRITEQARYEYTLAYVPRVYGTSSNYHVVRVETTREGLLVETRRGYYASSATVVPKN